MIARMRWVQTYESARMAQAKLVKGHIFKQNQIKQNVKNFEIAISTPY